MIKISENNKKLNEINEIGEKLNDEELKKLETSYEAISKETINFYNEIKNLLNKYFIYETNNNNKILDKIDKIQKNKYAETLKNQIIAKSKQSRNEYIDTIKKLDVKIAEYQEEEEEEE